VKRGKVGGKSVKRGEFVVDCEERIFEVEAEVEGCKFDLSEKAERRGETVDARKAWIEVGGKVLSNLEVRDSIEEVRE